MTRAEILRDYTVDANGTIRTPGKFEAEMLYVPFYWDSGLNGCASEDIGRVWFFEILTDERQMFPELGSAYGIAIEESEQGFVYAAVYNTQEDYERALKTAEQDE